MQCPTCQRDNPPDNAFCGGCGGRLAQICPSCQRENPPDHAFCGGCGARIGQTPSPTTLSRSSSSTLHATPPTAGPPSSFAGGRYLVDRFIGEGARKRVYLARDTRLGRDVAVAEIKTEGLDANGRARVRREAEALGRLGDHPHIVTIHDVIEEGEAIHIVAQYLAGGDLEGHIEAAPERRLDLDEALRIAEEIAQALEHAHDRGIIHRDLKPGNIWLGNDNAASLGDFGLALALDRSRISTEGTLVGTVAYMPPEQALGRPPDARSDLYALGATLYEMLTGRPPFVGDDAVAIISQHINTPPVAPSWHNPDVHKPLEALVLNLLAKDPSSRPTNATEVRKTLEALRAAPSRRTADDTEDEASHPLDRLAAGVFVGREGEVRSLREGLDGALSGRGRVFMLVGEPGIGKTRSAEELVTYARMRGAQALWGRCYEGEGAPAYWPWVQIVRAYVHERDPKELATEMGPGAADIAEVVSEVRERLPGLPTPPPLDAEQARFRLFDSVTTFLRNASARAPLVLVLDDLHWADKSSLLLLQFLAREIGSSKLLLLGTYRDVELGRQHPLEETLAVLAREQLFERVLLRGLARADVGRFIGQTAHIDPPTSLVEAVHRETEGNPFFVSEVVRLLEADGRLKEPDRVSTWSLEVPQGVRQVVGRRLNALSEPCNTALTLASVIGREFDLETLAGASDTPREALLEAVEEARAARLIVEDETVVERYRFSHALVEQTLYEELSAPRRVPLHRRVGEAIERLHADNPGSHLSQIAYHFFQSVQLEGVERSVEASKRAGEWASHHLAYEEAAAHYERAVQALEMREAPDSQQLCELLVREAELRVLGGETDSAQAAALRATDLAREIPAPELYARAALSYGGIFGMIEMGRVDETMIRLLDEALDLLPKEDSPLRVRLLTRRAGELYFSMDLERVRAEHEVAVAAAERLGDPGILAAAIAGSLAGGSVFDFDEAIKKTNRVIELEGDEENLNRAGYAYAVRCQVHFQRGDRARALAATEEAAQAAIAARTPMGRYLPVLHRAMIAIVDGRFDEAETLAKEAFAEGRRSVQQNAAIWYGSQLSLIFSQRGDEVPGELDASRRYNGRFPDYPAFGASFLEVAVRRGALAEARSRFDDLAAQNFHNIPQDANYWPTIHWLADACAALGDHDRARTLRELMLPGEQFHVTMGAPAIYLGTVARSLGGLETLLGQYDEAETHFVDAIAREKGMQARAWCAITQFDFARMLIERGGPGDDARSISLLGEVLETAQELGMRSLVESALAIKLEAQGVDTTETQRSVYAVANAVQSQQPDLRSHAAPDGTVTIMFSDMEGFTEMTERLGDLAAREVIREHNRIVREQLAAHGGYEVELQGDGFLLAFSSARRALLCAIDLQRAFAQYNAQQPEQPIRVRIGLHTGEALKDADKFFGKTVILAARIAAQAQGGQILVSSLLKELTASTGDLSFGQAREAELKGISERQRMHSVAWE